MLAVAVGLAVGGCSSGSPAPGAAYAQPSHSGSGGLTISSAPMSPASAAPSTIAPHDPNSGPPADPFTGTPADRWANGAAGIALPAAGPVGSFNAAQVRLAYEKTRALLVAADLDRPTLLGGQPTAFMSLLISKQRTGFADGLDKTGVNKQGSPVSTRRLIMSFAPGGTQLIGSAIRVRGTMRAHAATVSGGYKVLDVDADYIFVYPVQPPHQPTHWMRVVNQTSWTVMFGNWAGGATSFEPWVEFNGVFVSGVECGSKDGYVHPGYPVSQGGTSASPSGSPVDPYVIGNSEVAGCKPTTGT